MEYQKTINLLEQKMCCVPFTEKHKRNKQYTNK